MYYVSHRLRTAIKLMSIPIPPTWGPVGCSNVYTHPSHLGPCGLLCLLLSSACSMPVLRASMYISWVSVGGEPRAFSSASATAFCTSGCSAVTSGTSGDLSPSAEKRGKAGIHRCTHTLCSLNCAYRYMYVLQHLT